MSGIEGEVRRGMDSSSAHAIFLGVFEPSRYPRGGLEATGSDGVGVEEAGGAAGKGGGEGEGGMGAVEEEEEGLCGASGSVSSRDAHQGDLAGLGVVGNDYRVTCNLKRDALKGTSADVVVLRRFAVDLRTRLLPQLRWMFCLNTKS